MAAEEEKMRYKMFVLWGIGIVGLLLVLGTIFLSTYHLRSEARELRTEVNQLRTEVEWWRQVFIRRDSLLEHFSFYETAFFQEALLLAKEWCEEWHLPNPSEIGGGEGILQHELGKMPFLWDAWIQGETLHIYFSQFSYEISHIGTKSICSLSGGSLGAYTPEGHGAFIWSEEFKRKGHAPWICVTVPVGVEKYSPKESLADAITILKKEMACNLVRLF